MTRPARRHDQDRADVSALDDWVEHELSGYPPGVNVPEYRGPFQAEVLGTFGDPFGSGMRNAPIPSVGFPSEFRDGALFEVLFTQPISEIEELSQSEKDLQSPWPANAIAYTNTLIVEGQVSLYQGMGLQQAWRVLTRAQIVSIIDAVRTRILDLALTLERTEPTTGQVGAPPLPPEAKSSIVTNIFGGSPNVAVASTDFSQSVSVQTGDWNSLKQYLSEIGIPEPDINDLASAVERDNAAGGAEMGPETSRWFARIMLRARELGIGTTGGLIANALSQYLGLG